MHCFNAMIVLGIILCLWVTPYLYGVTYVRWVAIGTCGPTCAYMITVDTTCLGRAL